MGRCSRHLQVRRLRRARPAANSRRTGLHMFQGAALVPHLAITMGDPAGIGPEIIVKACAQLAPRVQSGELGLLVLGDVAALRRAEALLGMATPIPEVAAGGTRPPIANHQSGPRAAAGPPVGGSAAGGRGGRLAVERAGPRGPARA